LGRALESSVTDGAISVIRILSQDETHEAITFMLLNLVIHNFAIIDRLEVAFDAGFNVLTGETGAGKSIIMGAVGLLLGDRASPDLVRAGAEDATVEAFFDVADHVVFRQALQNHGFEGEDDLVIRRVVSRSGRSRAYLNGSLVTLSQLQPLAELLMSVCGQHAHQALLHREAHQSLLDQYGNITADVTAYRETFLSLQQVAAELEALAVAERERHQRIDFLAHQSAEIVAAKLSVNEEVELQAERRLLQHAEQLVTLSRGGYETLYGAEGAVCEQLGQLADELESVGQIDPQLAARAEVLRRSLYELEDVASELRSRADQVSFEPGRQEEVEERLAVIAQLKRKYAPTVEEILTFQQACEQELVQLEHVGETRDALQADQVRLTALLQEKGSRISALRGEAALRMEEQVMAELTDLAMPGTRFHVQLTASPEPTVAGFERVEFLIAPNQGEALLPLGKVASGGELSRILLALKQVAPEREEVPTLVFDEVDAGIGGVTASSVGRKLYDVSRAAQVVCVTHLPQVAAFADQHFRVTKSEVDGRTLTELNRLDDTARVEEMARMLGGARTTDLTLESARELISLSRAAGSGGGHDDP